VLDTQAMVDIDTSGAEVLHQVLSRLAERGVTVAISRANAALAALLAQYTDCIPPTAMPSQLFGKNMSSRSEKNIAVVRQTGMAAVLRIFDIHCESKGNNGATRVESGISTKP
jgi:MFS superfamily sulfate permease-like transporter